MAIRIITRCFSKELLFPLLLFIAVLGFAHTAVSDDTRDFYFASVGQLPPFSDNKEVITFRQVLRGHFSLQADLLNACMSKPEEIFLEIEGKGKLPDAIFTEMCWSRKSVSDVFESQQPESNSSSHLLGTSVLTAALWERDTIENRFHKVMVTPVSSQALRSDRVQMVTICRYGGNAFFGSRTKDNAFALVRIDDDILTTDVIYKVIEKLQTLSTTNTDIELFTSWFLDYLLFRYDIADKQLVCDVVFLESSERDQLETSGKAGGVGL